MTIAEIDTDDVEVIEPLSKTKAKALDKKVRSARNKVVGDGEKLYTDLEALYELVVQAATGQIHKALGVTWAAWFKDAAQIPNLERAEKKEISVMLAGKTLSLRMIAGVVNVDKHTVSNYLDEAEAAGEFTPPDTVTGLDNKTYTRNTNDDEPIDAEYEELENDVEEEVTEEAPTPPTPAVELVSDFDNEVANLCNAVSALVDIIEEPKWPGAKRRCAKANLNDLQEWGVTMLTTVIDALMSD
jgi:hypothetical protein